MAVNGLSQAAIGRVLGLSPAAITKLKGQGMPVDSVEAAQAWRLQRQNVAARKPLPPGTRHHAAGPNLPPAHADGASPPAGASAPPAGPPFDAYTDSSEHRDRARTRREIAEANIAEMEEARQRRELIRVQSVMDQLALDYATTREGFLQMPARMAPLLAAESDPAAVERMLSAEIHKALTRLSEAPASVTRIEGGFE